MIETEKRTLTLLTQHEFLTRNHIEAALYFQVGISPNEISSALENLREEQKVHRTEVGPSGSSGSGTHIYSLKPLSQESLECCSRLVEDKHKLFEVYRLRLAAECYVRALLIRSGRYREIPRRFRLGEIAIGSSGRRADLFASDVAGRRVLFEVKNQREVFYPTSNIFGTLLLKAIESNADVPALVLAHASNEVEEYCRLWGIALLHLGRQILPNEFRKKIIGLRRFLGPQPFEFVNPCRPFQHGLSEATQRDLRIISDEQWLEEARQRWKRNRNLAWKFAYVLSETPSAVVSRVSSELGDTDERLAA